jgi:osmoprotectant transport system ATP-binding protein
MVTPDAGTVSVAGRDVAEVDPVELRRSVGYVQQEGGLLPHWTVLRNAALVPRLRGMADAEERAREALELVGIPAGAFGHRWPRELSGGQRQRVALARALAASPDLILLDEPFGALDAITRSELQDAFLELSRELGVTVLLVTHDLEEAFKLSDRVAVMRDGGIEQTGTPEELRREPAGEYVAHLLRRAGVA